MGEVTKINLKKSAARGGMWSMMSQVVKLVAQFASIAILARLLKPDDFGLVALVGGAVTIIAMFRELGLSLAIVQKDEVTDQELSCIFKFTIYLGGILFLASVCIGGGIAWFFKQEELIYIAPFFGLTACLSSLEVVALGLLRRRLKFGQIAIREIVATIIGTCCGITAAWVGAGYWSLVIMPLMMQGTNTVFSWMAVRWKPIPVVFRWSLIQPYLKFGGTLTLGQFSNYLCQNLDILMIGKIWGVSPLGYYTRSRALIANPINQIAAPMGSVLTPVLSRMNNDPQGQKRWVESIFIAMLVLGGIGGACLAALADDLVPILLGEGWADVGKLMFWMAPLIVVRPAGSVLYCFLISAGRLKNLLSWTWIGAVITISSIVIAVPFGVVAVAAALSIAVSLRMFVAIYFCSLTEVIAFRSLSLKALFGMIHFAVLLLLFLGIVDHSFVSEWSAIQRIVLITGLSGLVVLVWIVSFPAWRTLVVKLLKKAKK